MNYTEQLELEAEQRRRDLTASLDELRDRFSPGQMVDQLVDYVQEGSGGQFFHNLKRQVVGNPLPVTLIGAGVAWLIMANGRAHSGNGRSHRDAAYRTNGGHRNASLHRALARAGDAVSGASADLSARVQEASSGAGETFDEARARAEERGEQVKERAQETLSSVRESARETYSEIYDAATGTYHRVSERAGLTAEAVKDSLRGLRQGTAETGQGIAQFCREQPLVVAGLGLAIGAALGALLPASELENRVMGDASEEARRKARELASDAVDKVQVVGERVVEAAYGAAEEQGLVQSARSDTNEPPDSESDVGGEVPVSAPLDTVTVVPDPDPRPESDPAPRSG